jgi:tripartite motif-containing protein 71
LDLAEEELFVTDSANHRIQVWEIGKKYPEEELSKEFQKTSDPYAGKYLRSFGARPALLGEEFCPCSVVLIGDHVYLSDTGNHRISVWNAMDGSYLRGWGGRGEEIGQFEYPCGIASDGGELVVADRNNHRLQMFT